MTRHMSNNCALLTRVSFTNKYDVVISVKYYSMGTLT